MGLAERVARVRAGVYLLLIVAAVGAWLPYLIPVANRWLDTRRMQTNVSIVYTTETRGFLESCG
jgi:hypothetical protein